MFPIWVAGLGQNDNSRLIEWNIHAMVSPWVQVVLASQWEEKKKLLNFLQTSDFLPVVQYLLHFSVIESFRLHHHFSLSQWQSCVGLVKMTDPPKATNSADEGIELSHTKSRKWGPALWRQVRIITITLKIFQHPQCARSKRYKKHTRRIDCHDSLIDI